MKKDLSALQSKLNDSNKMNSLLKDDLEETSGKLRSIDSFYKGILDQKDLTIKECFNIMQDETEESVKLKRLLVKFRTEHELKFVQDIKSDSDFRIYSYTIPVQNMALTMNKLT